MSGWMFLQHADGGLINRPWRRFDDFSILSASLSTTHELFLIVTTILGFEARARYQNLAPADGNTDSTDVHIRIENLRLHNQ